MSNNNNIVALCNLKDGETLFMLNTSAFSFIQNARIDYSPKIKVLIRIMDTPAEDIYHHYIVYKMPPIMHTKLLHNIS